MTNKFEEAANALRNSLLSLEQIKNISQPLKNSCGIYFLIFHDEIVYVGQSINISQRVHAHKNDDSKVFDKYAFVVCDEDMLLGVESLYISKFKPRYNRNYQARPPNQLEGARRLAARHK